MNLNETSYRIYALLQYISHRIQVSKQAVIKFMMRKLQYGAYDKYRAIRPAAEHRTNYLIGVINDFFVSFFFHEIFFFALKSEKFSYFLTFLEDHQKYNKFITC